MTTRPEFYATKLALAITLEALFAVARRDSPRFGGAEIPNTEAERRRFFQFFRGWLLTQRDPVRSLGALIRVASEATEQHAAQVC